MLDIDEIIESDAYDNSGESPQLCYSPMPSGIKIVPPPPPLPRKYDPALRNHKVVHPSRDSCFNLPIIFPSLGETTKSRVETQIRVTIDLAHPSSDPTTYDRVGSWKWLKLPQGTATKRRSRKQGNIEPDPQDMLYLTFSVTCASEPYSRVASCSSCQSREAKRVAKKIAARVRPAPTLEEGTDSPRSSPEDTSSIIQFNCAQIIDFSTGSTTLPLRITCYCRHHREKLGFNVNLILLDHTGRIVGIGSSKPIMITDDHKTVSKVAELPSVYTPVEYDWANQTNSPTAPTAPSKRKKDPNAPALERKRKDRAKPYDSSSKPNRLSSRETSVSLSASSAPSPQIGSPPPMFTSASSPPTDSQLPSLNHNYLSQESLSESSPDGLITPTDPGIDLDIAMLGDAMSDTDLFAPHPHSPLNTSTTDSLASNPMINGSMQNILLPFLFSPPSTNATSIPPPTIHRLIPGCGPTHGGIEVTVLGANFHAALTNSLTCMFGGTPASSTQRWSDNALVCVLPPRASAGVVDVKIRFNGEGGKEEESGSEPPTLFTYSDESDRALMELALQVVGLKMTGKIEDAKNVAMRIVGAGDTSSSSSNNNGGNNVPMNTSSSDLRSLLLLSSADSSDFESLIIKFLSLLDLDTEVAISQVDALAHTTKSGQTLLHLAAFSGYYRLVESLVSRHGMDMDRRDRSGWTALHFACISAGVERRQSMVALMKAGVDMELVDAWGRTAAEVGVQLGGMVDGAFDEILRDILVDREENFKERDDEMAGYDGEGEEEDDDHIDVRSAGSRDDEDRDEGEEDVWWGDGEEDVMEPVKVKKNGRRSSNAKARPLRKRLSKKRVSTPAPRENIQSSAPSSSQAATAPQSSSEKAKEAAAEAVRNDNEKEALSFLNMLQRTMAQLPGAPHMPAVPWGALPHLPAMPLVFPMMLPSLFGGANTNLGGTEEDRDKTNAAAGKEWRAMWEKWIAQVTRAQAAEEEAPPQYTPRMEEMTPSEPTQDNQQVARPVAPSELVRRRSNSPPGSGSAEALTLEDATQPEAVPMATDTQVLYPQSRSHASSSRRFDYQSMQVTEQEVDAYRYQPKPKQKKRDRMLVLFWIPILIISLIWACHSGLQFAVRAVKTPISWKKA
ncbi:spt3 dosage dependent suppressor of ty-induced promoter mutations-like protein [Moniliophthora roreri MCA 2997]|uniref:Spt3 dosage dependent suppressor of ty-induced promoter mutations-like protein n=1 Tax=Moniliophthora roreri (strain MCA 2997) TaxID=1381753 RepID=V2XBU7_MONRO|nr:spt3 dosage dependent suppressor of ty-induced promoter mutations-like protein [Moniliophthora roreri MCA 2997]